MLAEEKFKEALFGRRLCEPKDSVLTALSGGSDSVFLLLMLCRLRAASGLTVGAFHLNHLLRKSAGEEEAFCAGLCQSLGIPIYIERRDAFAFAAEQGLSIEESGRELRYRLMEEIRAREGYTAIATAHHAQDNAETVFMRILRGTAVRGLAGIPEKNGRVVRPMLDFSKEEILSWLSENGAAYKTDESNQDPRHFRNRVRNEMLPVFRRENPQAVAALNRLSRSAAAYAGFAMSEAQKVPMRKEAQTVSAPASALSGLHDAVLCEALLLMAEGAGGGRDISYLHLEAIAQKVREGKSRWRLDLPGVCMEMRYGTLEASNAPHMPAPPFSYPLAVGAVQIVTKAGFAIASRVLENTKKNTGNDRMRLNYDKMNGKFLRFRSRSEGDSFSPLGMGSRHKSLKKFFIDRKVPDWMRSRTPILICDGEIALVGNLALGESYKVLADTAKVLEIRIMRASLGIGTPDWQCGK
ncbi:MAG: tRNA lysidine(34) synthetase TilS [Eubacteriaceae bacterium]|jgi:tRNA(Ile)-lysidine synthase|nr:tRNA lysidine(34) synthetase TilS [Eubacteriaceae bacterium]